MPATEREGEMTKQQIGDLVTTIIGEWPMEVIMPTRPTITRIVEAVLAHPTPTADTGLLDLIVRDVAELPDRSSPEDWPEAMLVTGDELKDILRSRLSTGEQEVGELVEAAEMVADSELVVDALHNAQFHYLATMLDGHLARLRAALDKVRGRG